jgi:hypothetical protein
MAYINSFRVPGVLPPREIDLTLGAKYFDTSIGGAILVSRKGGEENLFQTRVEDFDLEYGLPDPTWSFDHYCIRKFLSKGKGCWIRRIQRLAKHAGSVVFNDRAGSQGTATYFKPFADGRFANYLNGSQQLLNFKLSGPLATGQTISFTYSNEPDADPADEITVTQAFDTSNDNTLNLLATKIKNSIEQNYGSDLTKSDGFAFVNKVSADVNNDRLFSIVSPEDQTLYVTDVSVTGSGTIPIVTMFENSMLMEVYAKDPGAWGGNGNSGVGYRLVNAANGINQIWQLNFSAPLVANQQVNLRIYYKDSVTNEEIDVTLDPTLFDTDQTTTATTLAAKIKAVLGPSSDVYLTDGMNGLQIIVVSPSDGPDTISFPAISITNKTGNAALPNLNTLIQMQGVDNDQTFDFEVYTRDNINTPKEVKTVSFVKQVNGSGQQVFIEDVINTDSSTKSAYVRVKYNDNNAAGVLFIPPTGTDIQWLNGGDDGVLPTTGDIVLAWNYFKSRQKFPMRILINNGHTAVAVHQTMTNLAKSRYDCIAILDWASDKQKSQAAFEYRNAYENVDSSYSAFYTPDVKELDPFRNLELFVPPSGHVAAQYAETDEVAAEWFAPAGLNRAILDTALGLREDYDEDEMQMLIDAQINPIINRNGVIVIWDQVTTQRKPSAFRNVSLRRMLITIEISIVDGLDYTIHEPNDDYTAVLIIQICVSILQPIKEGRGLYDYAAISDDRNNKDYDYNNQQRNVDVILDPILPIRTIRLSAVVVKKGASFSETEALINGGSTALGA